MRDAHAELLISAHASILSTGFHAPETDGHEIWRWSDGDAHLPPALFAAFPDGCELVVRRREAMAYWLAGPDVEICGRLRQAG